MKVELTREYKMALEDLEVDDYDLDLTMKIVLAIEKHAIKHKLDYGQIIHSLNLAKHTMTKDMLTEQMKREKKKIRRELKWIIYVSVINVKKKKDHLKN